MNPVLVTGAAGFIGSHTCQALLSQGQTVVGLDNFDPYYDAAIKRSSVATLSRHAEFTFVEGDLRDRRALAAALTGCDAVVHCAARPGVRASWDAAGDYHATNVLGTADVVAACHAAGVRRFVFASSSSVYGDGPTPFLEDNALAPVSPYAESKARAEDVCRAFGRDGAAVAIVRLFSVYGPRLRPDLALHTFVRNLAEDQPLPRYGDGTTQRDYTHVDDAVRGLLSALDWTSHGQPCCEAFNVGSGQPVTLNAMIALLADVMQRRVRITAMPTQRGDVHRTWADLGKTSRALHYRPRVGLVDGLHSLRRWYEESHGRTP